jgi:hypothetical protein
MPERPARRRDQDVSTSAARGVTAPMPVTTIRRIYSPVWARGQRYSRPGLILCGHSKAIATCFTSADRAHRDAEIGPFLSSSYGFANLLGRRIQKGLGEVGVVDDPR